MEKKPHVFILSYLRPAHGELVGQLIGVYSTLQKVEEARSRLRHQMGYRDYPEGFLIHCYRLDEDYDDPTFMALGE